MTSHARWKILSVLFAAICPSCRGSVPASPCYNQRMAIWMSLPDNSAPPLAHPIQAQPTTPDPEPNPEPNPDSDLVTFARTRLNFQPDPVQESML